tara:strand:- start:508 stop:861 length:354 start_codon:yes stop_codon:yes gene_type:complete
MVDQPKLAGYIKPWEHVAREFGDHDMETEGGYLPYTSMVPITSAHYIGDWVPVEAICKEVVRLRGELDRVKAERDKLLQCVDLIASPLGDEGQMWATEKAREALRAVAKDCGGGDGE